MPRLSPIYRDVFTGRVDDLRFILKAPIVGWYEAARGTRYERAAEVILNAPPGRVYSSIIRRARLVWVARTMEGGANPEAYFQVLFNMLSQELRRDAELLPALGEFIMTMAVIITVFASISLLPLGPVIIPLLASVGFMTWFLSPKDHWLSLGLPDVIGITTGVAIIIIGTALGKSLLFLPIALTTYGAAVLPSVIRDYGLAGSLALRVMTSFNEILTRPVPTPLRDLSPVEAGLKPLWLDARSAGAPRFVSWANTLVGLYMSTLNQVRWLVLVYAVFLLGMGAGVGVVLPWYMLTIMFQTGSQALVMASQYSGFLLSNMPMQSYWTGIGVGIAGGYALFDHRTGALMGGVLGLASWFLLHPFLAL